MGNNNSLPNTGSGGPGGTPPFVAGGSQDPNNPGLPSLAAPAAKQPGDMPTWAKVLFPIASQAGRSVMFPLLSRLFK